MYSRAVHWFWFPILALAFGYLQYSDQHSVSGALGQAGINLAFIFLQFLLLTAYFSFKHKKLVNLTNGLLGWGDLLFWVVMGCYLSLLNFIFFYILSIIVILLGWLTYHGLSDSSGKRIPLAGLQSALLAILLILSWTGLGPVLHTDDQIIKTLLQWT